MCFHVVCVEPNDQHKCLSVVGLNRPWPLSLSWLQACNFVSVFSRSRFWSMDDENKEQKSQPSTDARPSLRSGSYGLLSCRGRHLSKDSTVEESPSMILS